MHLGWLSGWPFAFGEGRYPESPRVGIAAKAASEGNLSGRQKNRCVDKAYAA